MRMRENQVRPIVAALGIGTLIFGVAPVLAPRQFARLFGFPAPDLAVASMIRSLGVRDVVMGLGLWSAAAHHGKFAPWLLARTLTDGGDALAISLAASSGYRPPRFLALGALALGAAGGDTALYWTTRQSARNA